MNRRLLFAALACFLAAGGCVGLYRLIGSHVDERGFLHEPFALLPIGWLCLFLGVFLLGLAWLRRPR